VQYDDARQPALRSLDLQVAPGRHLAIVGPSGAGKTTLIGAVAGLVPRVAGSVLLGGVPVEEIGREGVWAMSAVIAQDTWLFNVSLRENIRLGRPTATDHEVMAAAEAASLGPLIAVLPDGLDTVVGEYGARLSGGERQRVAIARAILKDAPLLLLDEPTEGLDAVTQEAVLAAIMRLAEGRTLLMVTHQLIGLEGMNEIVVMSEGRIAERGTHPELLARQGLYAELSALQADLVHDG
jgi:ABC-type multidrug transport system fused ATPase/permease subunit